MRAVLTLALAVGAAVGAKADEESVPLDKLPKAVVRAVQAKFPKAELKDGAKETEGGKTVYEVTAKLDGKNLDVTVTEGGEITLVEKEVAFDKLPKAVAAGFEKRHPNATYKIVEAVIKVEGGKDTLDYYEALVTTADKKTFEIEILPDGAFKGETEKKAGEKD